MLNSLLFSEKVNILNENRQVSPSPALACIIKPPPHHPQEPLNQIFPAEAVKYAELITLSRRVKTCRHSVFVTKHSFNG